MKQLKTFNNAFSIAALISFGAISNSASADQVFLDDVIVNGSLCAGLDCSNGESFGFDTLRLKENNLRIRAQDTSASASFPTRDWQITFNDSSNGGQNKFSIDDIDGGRTPFTIEANAPSHSLYVDDGGRIGLGTSTPVAQMHMKDGNTPTVRLEQDGSSGFGAQTWDLAGNEANFFIRDASNGSTLPFRVFPGAPSNALTIEASGDIGMGTTSPEDDLHIVDSGPARLRLTNSTKAPNATEAKDWTFNSNGTLRISADADAAEFVLDQAGNLTILGSLTASGGSTFPDYVFQPDYNLMTLKDLRKHIEEKGHLPNIPSAAEVEKKGSINISKLQIKLLEKIEELTLYTLKQQSTIEQQEAFLKQQQDMFNIQNKKYNYLEKQINLINKKEKLQQ